MPVVIRPIWGVPRANRGSSYLNKALGFIIAFPLGTSLSRLQFQNWGIAEGYLPQPPATGTDLWTAFVHKRCDLLGDIRKGARSPLMRGQPSGPFRVYTRPHQMLEVLPLNDDLIVDPNRISLPIEALYSTLKRQFQEELQSAEWDKLSMLTRYSAESYYRDLDYRERQLALSYQQDVSRAKHHLEAIRAERAAIRAAACLPTPPPVPPNPNPPDPTEEEEDGE